MSFSVRTLLLATLAMANIASAGVPFTATVEIEDWLLLLPPETCRAHNILYTTAGLSIGSIECRERLFYNGFEDYTAGTPLEPDHA